MNSRELKPKIEEKLEEMAEILAKGNDCELRTSPNGVAVIKVKKEVVSKWNVSIVYMGDMII